MEIMLMVFPKKFSFGANWSFLDQKIVHPHNSGFFLGIFFEILHSEGG